MAGNAEKGNSGALSHWRTAIARPLLGEGGDVSSYGFALVFLWSTECQRIAVGIMGDVSLSIFFLGDGFGCALCAIACMLARRHRTGLHIASFIVSFVGIAAYGVLCLPLSKEIHLAAIAATALSGLVVGWQFVAWGGFFTRLHISRAVAVFLGSLLSSSLLVYVFSLLPMDVLKAFACGSLPLVSTFCLRRARRIVSDGKGIQKRYTPAVLKRLIPSAIGVCVFSSVLGLFNVPLSLLAGNTGQTGGLALLGSCLLCLFLFWNIYRRNRGLDSSVFLFGVLVVFVLSLTLVGFRIPALMQAASVMLTFAQGLLIVFLYLALFDVARNSVFPDVVILAAGWGAYDVSLVVGNTIALVDGFDELLPTIMLSAICTVVIVQFFVTSLRVPQEARLFLDLNPETRGMETTIEDRVAVLGERAGLTDRECEVVVLYARGRTRAYIAQKLYLSESTVRDRITCSYRKLGIHSKQELIDRIAETEVR